MTMTNKKRIILLLLLFILQLSFAQSSPRTIIDFNKNWKFFLGDDSAAIHENYDDSKWRTISLPHDWSIEGEFRETNPATTQSGALPGGIGWYRKTFTLPATAQNKNVRVEFDGIYRNSEVWINGQYLGKRPNGYISFQYDLSPYIKQAPEKNIISVKVDNSQQPNSRWYSGSGIYRNVRLILYSPIVAVSQWGTFVTAPDINQRQARINIAVVLSSSVKGEKSSSVYTSIYDAEGKKISVEQSGSGRLTFTGNETELNYSTKIFNPKLWSVERPYLYRAVIKIFNKGKLVDEYSTRFGIRYFNFDENKGLSLNGKSLKIKGVCMHHDLGALGAAVNKRAIQRQLEILKAMGCNAVRTAHNPPAPELLDICDEMGFIVIDESFDMWKKKKTKYDYSLDFEEWHKQDVQDMVIRDRNHPSVFMWSIGNEIREQFDSTGINITKELVSIIKDLDSTRPVTAGLSEWNPEKNFMYRSGALDVVGLNYHHEVYKDFPKYFPGQKFIGTENMSALATRGSYSFPSDSLFHWPEKSPQRFVEKGNADYTVSAYDQVSAYWGSTHEETWKIIKKYDYLSGLFVWTGFDYLGEPTPYPWPARSSYFGVVDLAGFPKDVYYMYQSEWTTKPVLHIFPHWNWQHGEVVDVWAYYNNADEVELFLNGRSLGVKKKMNDELHVMWRVSFEPGIIKAISRKNGKTVLIKQIHTAGKPEKIILLADRNVLKADSKDLSFVTVKLLDKDGNLVPNADNLIHFNISSSGSIAGTDNGYQADTTSFKTHQRKCWKGMALVIIQSSEKKGNITLSAKAEGLKPAFLTLKTVD
ncbi:MAG TPA: beta-galactosidase GalB [Chitinophagaceae bacterium]|nr:beta-galactosidase GalB [Chitinophagaceae bacterium]